jgi:AraC-like DNA-binding protein
MFAEMAGASGSASVRLLHPFGAVLSEEGAPLDELLKAARISANVYSDPDARVPAEAAMRFLRAAVQRTRHPALGLVAARNHEVAQFQLLQYLAATSADVAAAAGILVRYQELMTDYRALRLERHGDDLLLQYGHSVAPRMWTEYIVGGLALALNNALMGYAVGSKGSPIQCAWFAYPEPKSGDVYREFFGGAVRFEAPANGLLIPAAYVHTKPPQANSRVHDMLERHVQTLMQQLSRFRSLSDRVRALIAEAPAGSSLDRIAAKLHMSRSTLKRGLTREGMTYNAILDSVRRASALRYLERPDMNLHEVAFQVGYRDLTAFHRAFRRWMRQGPAEYRAKRKGRSAREESARIKNLGRTELPRIRPSRADP